MLKGQSYFSFNVFYVVHCQLYRIVFETQSISVVTYDVQSLDITSTNGGRVCVICTFSSNTIAVGCEIELMQIDKLILSGKFDRDANIAEGCISNITTGYYDLYVYDVENDNTLSPLPAIIKNQVFVQQETTSVTITTTLKTTISALSIVSATIKTTISASSIASSSTLKS